MAMQTSSSEAVLLLKNWKEDGSLLGVIFADMGYLNVRLEKCRLEKLVGDDFPLGLLFKTKDADFLLTITSGDFSYMEPGELPDGVRPRFDKCLRAVLDAGTALLVFELTSAD